MKRFLDIFETIVKMVITLVLLLVIIALVINAIYPLGYRDDIIKYSEQHNLDPYLVMALINTESHFNKNAISEKGAMGLMQIQPDTGEWIASEIGLPYQHIEDLKLTTNNIRLGCWYLEFLLNKYGDINTALAAYNAGVGHVDEWLAQGITIAERDYADIPFPETRHYIRKIRSQTKTYKTLDGIYERKHPIFSYGTEAVHWIKGIIKEKVNK